MRLRELAGVYVRYGSRRLHILLRREGWKVNHKRVERLYREEGLSMRTRVPKRRKACRIRQVRPPVERINECWSMDFMADELFDGRRLRLLTIVDNFTRESLAIEANQRITGRDVARTLARLGTQRALPKSIRVDNGPEFISKAMDQWAYWNKVELDFSRPGKPTDNAFIESFNARLRQECLNENWFFIHRRRSSQARMLASSLQRGASSRLAGQPGPQRIRQVRPGNLDRWRYRFSRNEWYRNGVSTICGAGQDLMLIFRYNNHMVHAFPPTSNKLRQSCIGFSFLPHGAFPEGESTHNSTQRNG